MGEWQELIQTVILGLIFSYLVAKLISTVVHFREENLTVVREKDCVVDEPVGPSTTTSTSDSADDGKDEDLGFPEERSRGNDGGDEDDDDDDDWEGVESTELDEVFSAATVFVAATAADRSSKVPNEVQLQLYGLYKIATEGPCTVPQPSALKMTARAKWDAWQKLGAMPPEEAMEKYIEIVTKMYPSWGTGSAISNKQQEGNDAARSEAKGPVGPVFSSFIHEEGSDNEVNLEDAHVFAREGKAEDLIKFLDDSGSVNLKDSEGRTPLHWAVDRGHLHVVKKLINNKADVNAKDNEGQTPLHYAALCEREAIAEFLVKHEADRDVKDNDGNLPSDLGGSAWSFMSSGN